MEVRDFLGQEIIVGCTIVYAKTVGRSAALTVGEVTEIIPYAEDDPANEGDWNMKDYARPHPPERHPVKLKVKPIADAYEVYQGRHPLAGRWSTGRWDAEAGKYVRDLPVKPVILRHLGRIMVIPQAGELTTSPDLLRKE